MAANLNKVMIMGRLGTEPDYRVSQQGMQICKLNIATNDKYKDKSGEWKEETDWHRVVLFGNLADIANKYLKKGRAVYIEGKIKTSSYDKDGEKRYSTDIIANTMQMLDSLGSQQGEGGTREPVQGYSDPDTQVNDEDDVPF